MTARPRLLLLGGRRKLLEKAAGLGIGVVFFQLRDKSHLLESFGPEHAALVDAAILADFTDLAIAEALAGGAHRAFGFERVLSLTEPGLVPAARISDRLDLGATTEKVALRFRDKLRMRRHLETEGFPSARAALVNGVADLECFAGVNGYPFIVKPVDGSGSMAVSLAKGPSDLPRIWEQAEEHRRRQKFRFYPISQFMAEEFLPGTEFSVETFSYDGRHVPFAVTEKLTLENFVEIGHAIPARLDSADQEDICNVVVGFLAAMGLRDGPAHTEVRLGPDGPRVIESQNRVGGDGINELVAAATGFDLDTMALGWPFGLVPAPTGAPVPTRAAATRFLVAPEGRLLEVNGTETARGHDGVTRLTVDIEPGAMVGPVTDSSDRHGQVISTAPTTAEAVARADRAAAAVAFIVEPPFSLSDLEPSRPCTLP